MTAQFDVIDGGLHATIQDLGRFGYSALGVSQGGPLDLDAFNWCNQLLGNHTNSALLEITLGGLKLKNNAATVICLTGANATLTINGQVHQNWQSVFIEPNSIVEIGMATQGLRCYLGVSGGFNVEKVFGSRATVVREKIGPNRGQHLTAGDVLPFQPIVDAEHKPCYALEDVPVYDNEIELRLVSGYQTEWFDSIEVKHFFSSEYQVSNQFDRMGYRLKGRPIKCNSRQMYSEGIAFGAVQVPADGQPIVLLNDRQTLGGYPKMGSVFQLDIAKLAQCQAGAKVRFVEMSIEQSHNELHLHQYRRGLLKVTEV